MGFFTNLILRRKSLRSRRYPLHRLIPATIPTRIPPETIINPIHNHHQLLLIHPNVVDPPEVPIPDNLLAHSVILVPIPTSISSETAINPIHNHQQLTSIHRNVDDPTANPFPIPTPEQLERYRKEEQLEKVFGNSNCDICLEWMKKLDCHTLRYNVSRVNTDCFRIIEAYLTSLVSQFDNHRRTIGLIEDRGNIIVKENRNEARNEVDFWVRSWVDEYKLVTYEESCRDMFLMNDINGSRVNIPMCQARDYNHMCGCVLEVCYDRVKHLYKIIHVYLRVIRMNREFSCEVMELDGLNVMDVEVEQVGDYEWKNIEVPTNVSNILRNNNQKVVGKTNIGWYIPQENVLVSFDIELERFLVTQLPQALHLRDPLAMFVVGGSIMFLHVYKLDGYVRAKIWMHEDGIWVNKKNFKRKNENDEDMVVPNAWNELPNNYAIKSKFPIPKVIGQRYIIYSVGFSGDEESLYMYDLRMEESKKVEELRLRTWAVNIVHRAKRRRS